MLTEVIEAQHATIENIQDSNLLDVTTNHQKDENKESHSASEILDEKHLQRPGITVLFNDEEGKFLGEIIKVNKLDETYTIHLKGSKAAQGDNIARKTYLKA